MWKSISVSGAPTILHEVISRRQRSRAAESIGERPHRHAVVLTSRRWRGGRRMTPRRRPGPAAAADDEARNHQRGVPRHTNDVGATPGVPRPRPTIARHAAPPCSNFHRSSREPPPTRSECTQNRKQNHPRPRLVDTTSAKAANGAVEAILKSSSSSSFFTPSQHLQNPKF